ncbi:MAG: amino acid adenylation domain-containing protein [Rubripirellula sp.]
MNHNNIEDIYPLSPMQQGILYHSLSSQVSEYFQQVHWTFRGNLNVSAFEQAWQQVISRHPILRTDFHWQEVDEPVQIVYRDVKVAIERIDWREFESQEQEAKLEDFLQTDRARYFDLSQAPLMRLFIIHVGNDLQKFVWSFHHILLDGWSAAVVLKELFEIYTAMCRGDSPALMNTLPYRNYIAWLQVQDQSSAESFWRKTLKGFNSPNSFPFDEEDSRQIQRGQCEQQVSLCGSLTQSLRSFAKQHQLTLNTVLQGAWSLLLSRHCTESDVVFGTIVSGRSTNLSGAESMVGLLINALPLRVHVAVDQMVVPWLKQIQAHQIERLQFEYSPLVDVQQWSDVPAGQGLFESLLIFENYPMDESLLQQAEGLEILDVRNFERTNYPLTLEVIPGSEMKLRMLYDSRRFNPDSIDRMLGHLTYLLQQMVETPQRLGDLTLLTASEQETLADWNRDSSREFPTGLCIHHLFERQVELTPDAIALVINDQSLTYHQLNSQANQLAKHLQSLGVGPGVLVGIHLERSLSMVVALLATLKTGAAYVPLDPAYPIKRLAFILEDTNAAVLLTQSDLFEKLVANKRSESPSLTPFEDCRVICLDNNPHSLNESGQCDHGCAVSENNLAYVIYTSGTTGQPKGVAISHRSAVNFLHSMQQEPGFRSEDVLLAVTTLSFDISILELFLPLISGGRVVIASREDSIDGPTLSRLIESSSATVMQATPATWQMLLEVGWRGNERLKLLCGGEALSPELASSLLDRCGELWNMYGPTETTVWSTLARISDRETPITVGRPIANTQIHILDPQQQQTPIGVRGELHIGGEGLADGYWRRPDLTSEKFIANPLNDEDSPRLYKTGDLASWRADGTIEIFGRIDHQVKIRGHRIELGEIESALNDLPGVARSAVALREDRPGDQKLVAYAVMADPNGNPLDYREIREKLQQRLPNYMVPSAFVVLDALPQTPNGKLDRRRLPVPELYASSDLFVAPRNQIESDLARIWQEIFQIERVGIYDDFFELGGHSLLAVKLVSQIHSHFQINVHLKTVFQAQTIAEMADIIIAIKGANQDNPLLAGLGSDDFEEGEL